MRLRPLLFLSFFSGFSLLIISLSPLFLVLFSLSFTLIPLLLFISLFISLLSCSPSSPFSHSPLSFLSRALSLSLSLPASLSWPSYSSSALVPFTFHSFTCYRLMCALSYLRLSLVVHRECQRRTNQWRPHSSSLGIRRKPIGRRHCHGFLILNIYQRRLMQKSSNCTLRTTQSSL